MIVLLEQMAEFLDVTLPLDEGKRLSFLTHFDLLRKEVDIHFLLRHQDVLLLEYSILVNYIEKERCKSPLDREAGLREKVLLAIMMSTILSYLNKFYLDSSETSQLLDYDQHLLLALIQEDEETTLTSKKTSASVSDLIRNKTVELNWIRLFVFRFRRLFELSAVVCTSVGIQSFIAEACQIVNPFFLYISWLFYVPRLLTNLFLLLKHVIPNKGMTKEERALPVSLRFQVQMQMGWFELVNDIVWLAAGVLTCFTPILAVCGVGLLIGLAVFDAAMALIRYFIDVLIPLKTLKKIHNPKKLSGLEGSKLFIDEFNKRLIMEEKRAFIGLASNLVIAATMSCSLLLFTSSPIVPFLGALIILLITIINYRFSQNIKRPDIYFSKFSLFKPPASHVSGNTPSLKQTLSSPIEAKKPALKSDDLAYTT